MNNKIKKAASKAALALALTSASSANAASETFLEIAEIKGDSQDSTFKDSIEVLAWSWGLSSSSNLHLGSAGASGKPTFQDIAITKYLDRSTGALYKSLATGTILTKATLSVREFATEPFEPYISTKLEFEKLLISSAATGGATGEGRPTENITLNFEKFCIQINTRAEDGSVKAGQKFCYNIAQNKEV